MVAYSIFLNFVEVFTLTTFVYLYYSFSSRKQFCLLLTSLFLICELCDIFKENGGVLMSLYFLICLFHIFYNPMLAFIKKQNKFLYLQCNVNFAYRVITTKIYNNFFNSCSIVCMFIFFT